MLMNSSFREEISRARQREMQARAESQRMARHFRAQSRTVKSVELPRQRLRRALRAAFA